MIQQVLDISADDRLGILLMSEIRIRALRDPQLAAAYLAQESEMIGSVAQIIEDIARVRALRLRVSAVEAARLMITVWEGTSVRAAMAGVDYAEMCRRTNDELGAGRPAHHRAAGALSSAWQRSRRASHHCCRSGVAARASSDSASGVTLPTGSIPPRGSERGGRDVRGEQGRGAEAAVVVEVGQGGGQRRAHRQPDRRVEGARDDRREPRLRDDLERAPHPAERLGLDHEQVGRARAGDGEGVLGLAHALVGRDRNAEVLHPAAQLGELLDRRARLLDVLQVELREGVHRVLGLVEVPGAVRVDADPSLGAHRLAHGAHARDVVGEASARARRPSPSRSGSRRSARAPRERMPRPPPAPWR